MFLQNLHVWGVIYKFLPQWKTHQIPGWIIIVHWPEYSCYHTASYGHGDSAKLPGSCVPGHVASFPFLHRWWKESPGDFNGGLCGTKKHRDSSPVFCNYTDNLVWADFPFFTFWRWFGTPSLKPSIAWSESWQVLPLLVVYLQNNRQIGIFMVLIILIPSMKTKNT